MAKDFTKKQLQEAMARISRGDVPEWMDSHQKQAYALGVITDEHIIDCPRCEGRGWLSDTNPYADAACFCPHSNGRVLSELGKALVKVAFSNS